jgi:hypothetical protein
MFFFWLLLKDRLNTGNLLRRKNKALEDYNCAICNRGTEETSFHLFFECPFRSSCWNYLGIHCFLHNLCTCIYSVSFYNKEKKESSQKKREKRIGGEFSPLIVQKKF